MLLPGAGARAMSQSMPSGRPSNTSLSRTIGRLTSVDVRRLTAAALGEAKPRLQKNTKAKMKRWSVCGLILRLHLVGGLQHLVGRVDHARIHFIGALRGNEVGDLRHDVDVRGLKRALDKTAELVGLRIAGDRRARSLRFLQQIVADRIEAGWIDKTRQL